MKLTKQLISLFLVFSLILSASPFAFAVGYSEEDIPEPSEFAEETLEEYEEEPIPEDPEDASSVEDPVEEPEEAEPEEPDTDAEEAEEAEEAQLPDDAESASALPFGLTGMPEDYVFTDAQLAEKAALAEHQVPALLAQLQEGVDYEPNRLELTAGDEAFARLAADAYNAELESWFCGIAIITLKEISVLDAVTLAADPDIPLPAVNPCYIEKKRETPSRSAAGSPGASAQSLEAPHMESWYSWVRQTMTDPDPFLLDPTNLLDYQWHHDVINTYEAWGVTTGSTDVSVAIFSDGINAADEELEHVVSYTNTTWKNVAYYPGSDIGTMIACLVGGSMDNGKYGAGVAPGVRIMNYSTFDSYNWMIHGQVPSMINHAVENGADILLLIYVPGYYSSTMETAIRNAIARGVTVIAPVGSTCSNGFDYPATYDGVIGVAAVTHAGTREYTSSYGADVDVSAPGDSLPAIVKSGSIIHINGPESASALVAGAAALYMSKLGHVSPAQMEKVLEASCNKTAEAGLGAGIIDLVKMFGSKKAAPKLSVFDADNTKIKAADEEEASAAPFANPIDDGSTDLGDIIIPPVLPPAPPSSVKVPASGYLTITPPDGNYNMIIYTADGSNPAVSNGIIVNGEECGTTLPVGQFGLGSVTIKVAYITGLGVISKIATIKLNIQRDNNAVKVTVIAPSSIISGKPVTLAAAVSPDTAVQNVTWAITSRTSELHFARIDGSGTLYTSPGTTGYVEVQATAVNGTASTPVRIDVTNNELTDSLYVSPASASLKSYSAAPGQSLILTPEARGRRGNTLSEVVIFFKSSNPNVATVTVGGKVTAVAPGTATITCTAADGSNKAAVCKITVSKGVDEVRLTGQSSISPGSSAVLTAACAPSGLKGTTTVWSVSDPGITIRKGKLTVPGYLPLGSSFTVTVTVSDGYASRSASKTIYVQNKTTKVLLDYKPDGSGALETVFSKGSLKSAVIYDTDVLKEKMGFSNVLRLTALFQGYGTAVNEDKVTWISSDPKIASVDDAGRVIGHAPGTVKITAKANDGSKKTASVSVKVITPTSSISVQPTDSRITVVNYGKSIKSAVVLGDAFGKPSISSVKWDCRLFEVYRVYTEGWGWSNEEIDRTAEAKAAKYISISSKGVLKISKNAFYCKKMNDSYLIAVVTAATTDGTECSDYYRYQVCTPVDSLYISTPTITLKREDRTDAYVLPSGAIDSTNYFYAVSSNPEIASAECYGSAGLTIRSGRKSGTAKITVTSADQAKKSITITVRVE